MAGDAPGEGRCFLQQRRWAVWVEHVAFCMWQVDWLDARRDGDATRQAADRAVIQSYPTWEGYKGQFATQSYRDLMDGVIAAVSRDDPAPVSANVGLNCRGIGP